MKEFTREKQPFRVEYCPDLTHQIVASGGVQEEVNHWQEVRKSYVKEGDLTPTYKGEIVDGRLIIAPISKEAQTN